MGFGGVGVGVEPWSRIYKSGLSLVLSFYNIR